MIFPQNSVSCIVSHLASTETSWGPKRRRCSWWPCSSSQCFITANRWDNSCFYTFITTELWSISNQSNHIHINIKVFVKNKGYLILYMSLSHSHSPNIYSSPCSFSSCTFSNMEGRPDFAFNFDLHLNLNKVCVTFCKALSCNWTCRASVHWPHCCSNTCCCFIFCSGQQYALWIEKIKIHPQTDP